MTVSISRLRKMETAVRRFCAACLRGGKRSFARQRLIQALFLFERPMPNAAVLQAGYFCNFCLDRNNRIN